VQLFSSQGRQKGQLQQWSLGPDSQDNSEAGRSLNEMKNSTHKTLRGLRAIAVFAMLVFAANVSAQQQTPPPQSMNPPAHQADEQQLCDGQLNDQQQNSQQQSNTQQGTTQQQTNPQQATPQQANGPTTGQQQTNPPQNDQTQNGQQQTNQNPPQKKNDRIFGVIPNYSTVEGARDITPISAKTKFKLAAEGSFDPYEFAVNFLTAAKDQAENNDSAWGQGWVAYAKRYGADFANQVTENVMAGGVYPSLLREDPRYFQLGVGTFKHRFLYAATRLIVTRTDSGHATFNFSEFLGDASATAIGNIYIPASNRSASSSAGTFSTQIFLDGLGNELKEFWPDIRRWLTRNR
jgi:hypothetical protein